MDINNTHIDHGILMSYLLGEASKEQVKQVEEWLLESGDNQVYMDKLEELWIETGKLTPAPVNVDVNFAWDKVSNRIENDENKVQIIEISKTRKITRILYRIAAIFIIGIGIYTVKTFTDKDIENVILASNTIINDTLSDGSLITLNKSSKLTYPEEFKEDKREVVLEGEAFFDVERNEEKPFVIHAGIGNIKVLGTSFNVKAYPNDDIEVSVETGLVQLYHIDDITGDTSSVFLEAGSKGILNNKTLKLEKNEKINKNKFFWRNKTLIFEEAKLSKVIFLLEENYDITIELSNEEINDCLLTATFKNDKIEDILNIIAESFSLELTKEEKTYLLEGNGCDY